MKKLCIALLLCLLAVALMVSLPAFATEMTHDGACQYHSQEALTGEYLPWEKADSLPVESGRYYLSCDVTELAATHTISGDVDIILCLNGHTIHAPKNNKRTLRLQNGAQLTLCDCTAAVQEEVYQAGRLIPGNAEQGGAVGIYPRLGNDSRNTVLTLRDGIIDGTGVVNSANGGAINISQNDGSAGKYFGEFIMLGGQIKNCTSKQNGGVAVIGSGGRFTLSDGQITGCKATFGGAVIYSNNGHFVMTGGSISRCSSAKGGVARIEGTATMTLEGGSIRACTSSGTGGAVHMQGGSFTMTGGEITGCTATGNGGAVCLDGYDAKIAITGGSLTNNTAAYGGAVFFLNKTVAAELKVENATITGNVASRGGGIEFFATTKTPLYLGGKCVIRDNFTRMGYPNNINLVSGSRQAMLSTPLEEGTQIGISSRDGYAKNFTVIYSGVTDQIAGCFFSDEGHNMVCDNGELKQVVKAHQAGEYHPAEEAYTPWGDAYAETMALPTEGGFYQLTADIYMHGTTTLSAPVDITLCLNGYNIHTDGEKRIGYLTGGVQLTICDCTAEGEGEDYRAGRLSTGTETGGALGLYPSFGNDSRHTVLILRDGIIDGTGVVSPNGAAAVNLSQKDGTTGESKAFFYMQGGQIRNCTSNYRGGAVMLQGGGSFCLSGGQILTCSAPFGGAVYVGNGTLEMTGGTITGCSSDNGGAVYASGEATAVLTGGVLEKNTAVYGGGVSAMKGSTLTFQGITIRENTADYGGGIYGHGPVFSMEEGTQVIDNIARKTGAGVMLGNGAAFTLNGGTISGNRAVQTDADKANGHGAGILAQSKDTTVILNGGTVSDNIADGDGGGIYMSRNTVLKMAGGSVSGNSAQNGGGVYQLQCSATYSGGEIKNNTAAVTGGGILVGSESSVTLSGTAISGNRAESGGGLVVQGKSRFTMYGGTVSGNSAGINGGGIYGSKVSLIIKGGRIEWNSAKESGGGVLVGGGSLTMSGGTVSGNKSTHAAGILVISKGVFTLSDGTISSNTAQGDGGGVYISKTASFTMDGGVIRDNTAGKDGGGVYHITSTGVYNGGSIENNTAVKTGGGIILATESEVTMAGGTVSGNQAETGGGVLIQGKSKFAMPGGTICGNSASINGGGIYGWKVDYTIGKDAVVCHNTAKEVGGGMVCYSGKLVVEGTVSHNTAAHAGGISSLGMDATVELIGATVSYNKAHGDGAGVHVGTTAQLTMTGGTITGNLAGNDGGGVYQLSSFGVYKDADISGNTALRNGGGVFLLTNTTVNLTDCAFRENVAKHGGGVYAAGNTALRIHSCTMENNIARITGSAVYTAGNTALNTVKLTGNDAEQGYTVHNEGVTKLTGDTVFAENTGVLPGVFSPAGAKLTVADLGAQAHILVQPGERALTDVLGGAYDYEETDTGCIVTSGNRSEQEEVPETVPATTEAPEETESAGKALPFVLLALAAVLTAVAVVIGLKKEKQ